MARIGVFGLNMSPETGGGYRLIEGLMAHAGESRNEFLYLAHSPERSALPENVDYVGRSRRTVRAVQVLLNAPPSRPLLGRPDAATTLLGLAAAVPRRRLTEVDLWLWPHTCMPIPQLGPPTAAIAHDMIHRHVPEAFTRRSLAMRRAAEGTIERCAGLLCPSQATRDDLLSVHPALAERAFVFAEAPNEVLDAEACAAEIATVERRFGDRPFMLHVGFDWPNKNHELLVGCAAELERRHGQGAGPRFVLVGHRRSARLRQLIASAGVDSRVVDLGPVSSPELAALYHRATALAFPSTHEGFGIPLVEAMHYGLPILASDRSCIPEIVDGAGELLPADDDLAWADAIDTLLENEARRAELAADSREGARRYTWTATWQQLDEIFNRILLGSSANA